MTYSTKTFLYNLICHKVTSKDTLNQIISWIYYILVVLKSIACFNHAYFGQETSNKRINCALLINFSSLIICFITLYSFKVAIFFFKITHCKCHWVWKVCYYTNTLPFLVSFVILANRSSNFWQVGCIIKESELMIEMLSKRQPCILITKYNVWVF